MSEFLDLWVPINVMNLSDEFRSRRTMRSLGTIHRFNVIRMNVGNSLLKNNAIFGSKKRGLFLYEKS